MFIPFQLLSRDMGLGGILLAPKRSWLQSRSLQECVEFVLGPHDLKDANPYLPENHEKSFPLEEITDVLKEHPALVSKRPRRQSDKLRSTLNSMVSIRRVGSTRMARYSYDSLAENDEIGQKILRMMIRALLEMNGKAEWAILQKALGVGDRITHLNFNSALNYLADNGIVEKKGQRPQQLPPDPETGALSTTGDSRVIICTPKVWGWEPSAFAKGDGPTEKDEYADKGNDDTGKWDKSGGSNKKTHSITLTRMTSDLLEEINKAMFVLEESDSRKPANINRSTLIEVALWMLWRDITQDRQEVPSEIGGVSLPLLAQYLADYMSNQRSYI